MLILKNFLHFCIFHETETLKKLLIFWEKELLSPGSKNKNKILPTKFLIFSQKKAFLIFGKNGTPTTTRLPSPNTPPPKKILKFQETEHSYISGNQNSKTFLYFRKKLSELLKFFYISGKGIFWPQP